MTVIVFGNGSMYDPIVQAKHSAPCMFHNWIRKLILRLQKYQARDIDVIGAPAIGDVSRSMNLL